jgi:hypothetical protein
MSELGVWEPLTPAQVFAALADLDAPWWIAGGRTIDAFLGYESREHGDIDVGLLRRDQLKVQAALAGWDLQAADPPGRLRPWQRGELLPPTVHDVWCLPAADAAWGLQIVLDESWDGEGEEWEYRRHPAVHRPVSTLVWRADGVPYLAVEVQLLSKAGALSPKNEADFAACLPKLDPAPRAWLASALRLAHPGHPWIERLEPGAMVAGA